MQAKSSPNKMIYNKIGKIIHPLNPKILSRIPQLSTSLSFCSVTNKNGTNEPADISMDTQKPLVENNKYMQPVPKKKYGLSKVEEKDLEIVESLKKGNLFYPYSDPFERARKIFMEDLKCNFRKIFHSLVGIKLGPTEVSFFPRDTDILIIGGGLLGLTIAYSLRSTFPHASRVMVVDRDCSFPPLSMNLAQAVVTHQLFTDEEEIPMLKYGAEFFSSFFRSTQIPEHPPFKLPYEPLGSLVLVDNANVEEAIHRIELLKKYEIYNKVIDNETLQSKFPWLNTKDIVFGSLGMSCEGVIDPWAYLKGIKSKCISLGVSFVTAEVIDFGFNDLMPARVICKLPDGSYNSIDFSRCVLACGMEALNLTEMFNTSDKMSLVVKLPLKERVKYEYCFYNPEGPGLNTPLVIDPDGTYFRREGLVGHYVAGTSSVPFEGEKENEAYHIFQNKVEPFLMKRVPQFKKLQLVKGWVDLQEYCISNETGVLGSHPEVDNIIYALGFSHLGLQYIPAVARAAMELIFYEDYQTINFTSYHVENLWKKQHLEADRRRRELLESQRRVALTD